VLEKALSSGDFAMQQPPLAEILKSLRPLRLRSLDQLDFNTRGRLLTALLRVARQKKPPEPSKPAATPPEASAPSKPSPAPREEPQPARSDDAPVAEAGPAAADEGPMPDSEVQPADTSAGRDSEPAITAAAESPAAAPSHERTPEEARFAAYQDVMFLVGSVWRAAGEAVRAEAAFAASGRRPEEGAAPQPQRPAVTWREEADGLEKERRTRDAAHLHERHGSHAEAARLYEASGDLRSALRSSVVAKDLLLARRLLKELKPEHFLPVIEKAGAYQVLMEHYVDLGDFENVAKLYERARQFDQAALAWEKSGKLGAARKAFERAKDPGNAERVRQLEVAKLIERGDRLGAALLQISAGKREEAAQTLMALPAAKAFRFLQKAKLDAEALALARTETARAEAEDKPATLARWLEMLGDFPGAAEAWQRAERRDRALAMYEQAGNWQRAAELAEALRQRVKAIELYYRAGDKASAERVAAQPEPVAEVAASPSTDPAHPLEGAGEER
jgi:tetratricopeptide (TPR) repeat protein